MANSQRNRLFELLRAIPAGVCLCATLALTGCGLSGATVVVQAASASVRAGTTTQFTVTVNGSRAGGGTWSVAGGALNGTIDGNGLYLAPMIVPSYNNVQISYTLPQASGSASVTLLNPLPHLTALAPSTLVVPGGTVTVSGSGFVSGAQVLIGGSPVASTFVDSAHLVVNVSAPSTVPSSISVQVSNPPPGAALSETAALAVEPSMTVSPGMLTGGNVTITVTSSDITVGEVVTLEGAALSTIAQTASSITATGYLAPWKAGTVVVGLAPNASANDTVDVNVPIASTAVSYDVASRFATQAAFGPRPDVIEHIQQVGLSAFVDEQMAQPVLSYPSTDGRALFLINVVTGNSLLRARVAWALQTFIPDETNGAFMPSGLTWEQTLEADAFGNYKQILLDAASSAVVAGSLNLPGNTTPTDPNQHPNQNFARELMQLFSLGINQLAEDGTVITDGSGNPIPTYGQDTVLDVSRALTGWNYGPPTNPAFTFQGLDYSAPLIATETQHDMGSKVILGRTLSAGQTAEQDRAQVIDAIFQHPNLPPFVSRILIQRLVKSQPSNSYVKRIAQVFEDDGTGVRGNLAAVFKAILLDPEARIGDVTPQIDDGYLLDPFTSQVQVMELLSLSNIDDEPTYIPGQQGEDYWAPGTVFSYFQPSYVIPGTNINSPEFQLLTTIFEVQRSDTLWSIINGTQGGFNGTDSIWLYNNFQTVPEIVDALNHVLYHGTMPAEEHQAILAYCNGISDPWTARKSAVFLALNSDNYAVAH